jgi:hypothetical protein
MKLNGLQDESKFCNRGNFPQHNLEEILIIESY